MSIAYKNRRKGSTHPAREDLVSERSQKSKDLKKLWSERNRKKEAVDYACEAWARWALSAMDLGIPPQNIIARVIKYGALGAAVEAGIRLVEVDEMCELVDKAVARLDEKQRSVVVRHYFHWEPRDISAKELRMSRDTFANVLSVARRRIWDYLEGRTAGVA